MDCLINYELLQSSSLLVITQCQCVVSHLEWAMRNVLYSGSIYHAVLITEELKFAEVIYKA